MSLQKEMTTEKEETFKTLAQVMEWQCKQCQEPIAFDGRESYNLTGYCPGCAQMMINQE
ncbi:MAG: hypothetical protein V7641_610 [Blastocatellia bacterium]